MMHEQRCETCEFKTPLSADSGMNGCSKLNRNISWQQHCIINDAGCATWVEKFQQTTYVFTDMEGDAIGDCSDCGAHYEGMGEKAPCDTCKVNNDSTS